MSSALPGSLTAGFDDLPSWATILAVLLGLLVALTAVSTVLGVVFAGIAVGAELGSLTVGVVAALFGLAVITVPVAAIWVALSGDDDAETDRKEPNATHESSGAIDRLRDRYVAGEIDEDTFERRLDELLVFNRSRPTGSETGMTSEADPEQEAETGVSDTSTRNP